MLALPSKLPLDAWEYQGVNIRLLRLDLIHPAISGNKWFKLKHNLKEAKRQQLDTVITFGGAFSNHIAATAAAGKAAGLKTVGVIRGERIEPLNPTLQFAEEQGMLLHFISRAEYRGKTREDFELVLILKFGEHFLIPEGGYNALGVAGSEEILDYVHEPFDLVITACGTGTTLAGLVRGLSEDQQAIGVPVLKRGEYLKEEIDRFLQAEQAARYRLVTDYHFGGYAKVNDELIDFMRQFYVEHSVQLDPVYTGKMMFALYDQIEQGCIEQGQTVLAIHTGGLQGIAGMERRLNIKFYD